MYIRINLDIDSATTEELEKFVKAKLPEELNEALFRDKNFLSKTIQAAVRGQIRSNITEILQGKDYRNFLRDKISKEIGMGSEE